MTDISAPTSWKKVASLNTQAEIEAHVAASREETAAHIRAGRLPQEPNNRPSAVTSRDCVKSGWLWKQGALLGPGCPGPRRLSMRVGGVPWVWLGPSWWTGHFIKNWRRRWFVLAPKELSAAEPHRQLYYYETSSVAPRPILTLATTRCGSWTATQQAVGARAHA